VTVIEHPEPKRGVQPLAVTADGAPFALPRSAAGHAFFIDVDGTLIDIAATPDAVTVPDDLAGHLAALAQGANGAVAIVSGRTIATLDRLLGRGPFATAGLHGGQLRRSGGEIIAEPPPPALAAVRPALERLATRWPGILIEDKGAALAVHYRGNPAAAGAVLAAVESLLPAADGLLTIQRGKMVVELKPAGAGKGKVVRELMAAPPFAGRIPVAIGDDVTDEEMFTAVNDMGGISIRIGPIDAETAAFYRLPDPASVRAWLASFN